MLTKTAYKTVISELLNILLFLFNYLSDSSSASNNAKAAVGGGAAGGGAATASAAAQSVESAAIVKLNESNDRLLRDIAHQAAALKAELEISLLKGSHLLPHSVHLHLHLIYSNCFVCFIYYAL